MLGGSKPFVTGLQEPETNANKHARSTVFLTARRDRGHEAYPTHLLSSGDACARRQRGATDQPKRSGWPGAVALARGLRAQPAVQTVAGPRQDRRRTGRDHAA